MQTGTQTMTDRNDEANLSLSAILRMRLKTFG